MTSGTREAIENESQDITMDLLWEWWITTTQALVDTVGSEQAFRALRPHYLNANTAAVQILGQYSWLHRDDPNIMGRIYQFGSEAWLGGHWEMRAYAGGYLAVVKGCRTGGECKEICQLICHEIIENYKRSRGEPHPETDVVKGLFKGDDHCLIVPTGMDWKELLQVSSILEPLPFDQDELLAFRLQYVGESWVFTTRAFLDTIGSQRALSILRTYMRYSGLSFGMRMARSNEGRSSPIQLLTELVETINAGHMRKGHLIANPDGMEGEIYECPFSGAPPEVCIQYESFFKGACAAIAPEYDFTYDRMMSDGDATCHWSLMRRPSVTGPNEEDADREGMLMKLRWRLVNGEIGPQEYERILEALHKP